MPLASIVVECKSMSAQDHVKHDPRRPRYYLVGKCVNSWTTTGAYQALALVLGLNPWGFLHTLRGRLVAMPHPSDCPTLYSQCRAKQAEEHLSKTHGFNLCQTICNTYGSVLMFYISKAQWVSVFYHRGCMHVCTENSESPV